MDVQINTCLNRLTKESLTELPGMDRLTTLENPTGRPALPITSRDLRTRRNLPVLAKSADRGQMVGDLGREAR